LEHSLVCIAIEFEKTDLQFSIANIEQYKGSFEMGVGLADNLPKKDLRYILLISDGHKVNGDAMLKGIKSVVPTNVLISGGWLEMVSILKILWWDWTVI
jgi:hypothetical protein